MSEKLYRLLAKIYRNLFNFEIIALILIGIAFLLKNQGISGGSILLIISISFMANLYFYCALHKDDTIVDQKQIIRYLSVLTISLLIEYYI